MNKSGFVRLFLLAFSMLLPILPVQVYVVYFDLSYSLPWHQYSWSKIHGPQFDQIIKVPTYGMVFFDRWIPVAAGFMIFIFFGFGHDATKMYRTLLWNLGFGYCFPSVSPPVDSQATATVPAPNASNSTTLVGSAGGRAKSFFKERSFTRYVSPK
jgi:pheromone a factor receptor